LHFHDSKRILFGRQGKSPDYKMDIVFPADDKTVSRQQCALKLIGSHLHLICLSNNSPTMFKVGSTPYQLFENMVIEIGIGNTFSVEKVYPDYPKIYQSEVLRTNHGENKYLLKFEKSKSLIEEQKCEEFEEMDRTIPRSQSQNIPSTQPLIILKNLKDSTTFVHSAGKLTNISIGAGEVDQFKLTGKGVLPQHCYINYSEDDMWTISDPNTNIENSGGTYIYLRNSQEIREKVAESAPHKLVRNMNFFCGFTGFQLL
jgi:hypothetical protein